MSSADHSAGGPPGTEPKSATWNWHPELPLKPAPYWWWPPSPMAVARFLVDNFLRMTDRVAFMLFAFAVAYWRHPVSENQRVFAFEWMAWTFVRDTIALIVVAGGLYLWFHGRNVQGRVLRYDPDSLRQTKNNIFKFGDQLWDNMFYTLLFAAPIASAYDILMRWLYANDHLWRIEFVDNPVWFVLMFPLLTMYQGLHFYIIHRALHQPSIYKHVHAIHHRNVSPTSWSGLSMHPIELVLYFSSTLIFFVIPSHPVHMLFLLYWQLLGAPSGHSGFEAMWVKDKARLNVASFFHHLHHRYFECNYGNSEFPLDKLFGTFHDGSKEATTAVRKRQRQMRQSVQS